MLSHATKVYGVHKGAFVAAHLAQLVMVVGEYGRDFSNRQYAEWWGCDERTGWQHRAEAREVYGDGWRDVLAAVAAEVARQGVRSPGKVARLKLRVA